MSRPDHEAFARIGGSELVKDETFALTSTATDRTHCYRTCVQHSHSQRAGKELRAWDRAKGRDSFLPELKLALIISVDEVECLARFGHL